METWLVIKVDEEIPEPLLDDWDPSKLPREIKKEVRAEIHWFYWLQGKSYKEIASITGWSRWTIMEDLKWVQANLGRNPMGMENIRQMAIMSLRITRGEVMQTIEQAKKAEKEYKDGSKVPDVKYDHIAKLYDVASKIDETILIRYTAPAALDKPGVMKDMEDQMKAMVKYMIHKLGPEALNDFESFFAAQMALQGAKTIAST